MNCEWQREVNFQIHRSVPVVPCILDSSARSTVQHDVPSSAPTIPCILNKSVRSTVQHDVPSSAPTIPCILDSSVRSTVQHNLFSSVPMILCILNSSVSDVSPHTWAPRLWPTHVVLCCWTPLSLRNVNSWETHRATGFMLCTAAA
jgi:hypothetical protein